MELQFSTYLEFTAALVGFVCFLIKKSFFNKNLLWFLSLTVAVEYISTFIRLKGSNAFLFNIFNPIEILFFAFLLYKSSKIIHKAFSNLILALSVYVIFCISNILFGQLFSKYNSYTVSIGTLFVVYASIVFILNWLTTKYENQQMLLPYLWVVVGMMIFNIGSFSYVQVVNYIAERATENDKVYFYIIYNFLNVIEYGCFITGLIIDAKQQERLIFTDNKKIFYN